MSSPADNPRYAVYPHMAFDYCVMDLATGDRVSDGMDKADARDLADTMNTAGLDADTAADEDVDCAEL